MRYSEKSDYASSLVTRKAEPVTIWDMPDANRLLRHDRQPKVYPHGDVGARLKAARLALTNDSAEDFARSLDINAQTYRNYERGERKLGYDAIKAIADAGISLDWLFIGLKPMLVTRGRVADALNTAYAS